MCCSVLTSSGSGGHARVQLYSWQFFRIMLEITARDVSRLCSKESAGFCPPTYQLFAAALCGVTASLVKIAWGKPLLKPYARNPYTLNPKPSYPKTELGIGRKLFCRLWTESAIILEEQQ